MKNDTLNKRPSGLLVKGITVLSLPLAVQFSAGCNGMQKYGADNPGGVESTSGNVLSDTTAAQQTDVTKLHNLILKNAALCHIIEELERCSLGDLLERDNKKNTIVNRVLTYYTGYPFPTRLLVVQKICESIKKLIKSNKDKPELANKDWVDVLFFQENFNLYNPFDTICLSKSKINDLSHTINKMKHWCGGPKRVKRLQSFIKTLGDDFSLEHFKKLCSQIDNWYSLGKISDSYRSLLKEGARLAYQNKQTGEPFKRVGGSEIRKSIRRKKLDSTTRGMDQSEKNGQHGDNTNVKIPNGADADPSGI